MFGSICPCGVEGFAWLDKREIFVLSDSACIYEHAGQRYYSECVLACSTPRVTKNPCSSLSLPLRRQRLPSSRTRDRCPLWKHFRSRLRIPNPWRRSSRHWIDLDHVSKHRKLSKSNKERFQKSINSIAKCKSSSNTYSPKSAYGKLLKKARKLKKSIK